MTCVVCLSVCISVYLCRYFPNIFNASGGPEEVAKYGDWFSYSNTPRAKIFRRDHSNVKDIESMTKLMRYKESVINKEKHMMLIWKQKVYLSILYPFCS